MLFRYTFVSRVLILTVYMCVHSCRLSHLPGAPFLSVRSMTAAINAYSP